MTVLHHVLLERRLFEDGLLDRALGAGRLAHDPREAAALERGRRAALARDYDRAGLQAALGVNVPAGDAAAAAALAKLADARCTVVVTGQQAGLFTGPLYTIYKAVTTLNLARRLEAASGAPVVAVYWNATEDHDLSEIATATWPERDFHADFPDRGLPAARLPEAPVGPALAALLQALPATADREALAALLATTADRDDARYGAYSTQVLARLFHGTGLLVLEPAQVQGLNRALTRHALADRGAVAAALATGAAAMQALGLDPSFPAGNGTGIWLIDDVDGRQQIFAAPDGGLQLGGRTLATAELERRLPDPAQVSTSAYLRPVWQGAALPVAAYVAGPGEMRYHLQLREVFAHFGVPFPLLYPRNHATVLTATAQRLARQVGVAGLDIFRPARDFHNQVDLPPALAAAFDRAAAQQTSAEEQLSAALHGLLPAAAVGASTSRQRAELAKLRARALRAYRRRLQVDNGRVDRLFAELQPHGQLQERALNLTYLLAHCGPDLVARLIATLDPSEFRHYLIHAD